MDNSNFIAKEAQQKVLASVKNYVNWITFLFPVLLLLFFLFLVLWKEILFLATNKTGGIIQKGIKFVCLIFRKFFNIIISGCHKRIKSELALALVLKWFLKEALQCSLFLLNSSHTCLSYQRHLCHMNDYVEVTSFIHTRLKIIKLICILVCNYRKQNYKITYNLIKVINISKIWVDKLNKVNILYNIRKLFYISARESGNNCN